MLSCEYCEIFKNIRSEDQKLNLSENYNIYDKTSEAERYCSNRNSKISGSSWAGYQRLKTEKLFHKLEIAFYQSRFKQRDPYINQLSITN